MSFFSNLINKIRGINNSVAPQNAYIFGTILSGSYANWKTDPHPTLLCLGTYNGYVHGIQLHAIGEGVNFIVSTINMYKQNSIVTNPLAFYQYLKLRNPMIIKLGYRTYRFEYCNFRIVNGGLTNIQNCYPYTDTRDEFLNLIGEKKRTIIPNFSLDDLKNNIRQVISNTVKVWK